jgi:hypothetical protein
MGREVKQNTLYYTPEFVGGSLIKDGKLNYDGNVIEVPLKLADIKKLIDFFDNDSTNMAHRCLSVYRDAFVIGENTYNICLSCGDYHINNGETIYIGDEEKLKSILADIKQENLDTTLSSLSGILNSIKTGVIESGIDKDYCFVTDEDGKVFFLKRNRKLNALDDEGERYEQWPVNQYDGVVLWKAETYESRGLAITEQFLNALELEFLG